jgi:hypothetical protein
MMSRKKWLKKCFNQWIVSSIAVFQLDKFIDGLTTFGYQDLPLPKPKKNFDFHSLDAKSILIMNKLAAKVMEYLDTPLRQL